LFAEEDNEKGIKDTLKTEDVAPDAFTTEVGATNSPPPPFPQGM